MEPNTMINSPRTLLLTLAIGGSLALAGCAGNPPTEQLASASAVIKSAEAAGGPEYAPADMKAAQDKMTQAQLLLQDQEYEQARPLIEQAEADARVAERRALAAKAQRNLDDAQQGVQQIREEGSRTPIIVQ
jgi:outer membrane murein-binding lipoprotein Lpp